MKKTLFAQFRGCDSGLVSLETAPRCYGPLRVATKAELAGGLIHFEFVKIQLTLDANRKED